MGSSLGYGDPLVKIAGELEEARWDTHGQHSGVVRRGVQAALDDSDLLRQVSLLGARTEDFQAASERAARATLMSLQDLLQTAVGTNALLSTLVDLTRTPLTTGANERAKRGEHALRNGWYPEAVAEFEAAVDADPMNAHTQFLLGLARTADDRPVETTVEPLRLTLRYGAKTTPALAAGAALLAAKALRESGDVAAAGTVLTDAYTKLPDVPDVAVAYGLHHGDEGAIAHGLRLGPDLAEAVAVTTGTTRFNGLARALQSAARIEDPAGPVWRARAVVDGLVAAADALAQPRPPAGWDVALDDRDPVVRLIGAVSVLGQASSHYDALLGASQRRRRDHEQELRAHEAAWKKHADDVERAEMARGAADAHLREGCEKARQHPIPWFACALLAGAGWFWTWFFQDGVPEPTAPVVVGLVCSGLVSVVAPFAVVMGFNGYRGSRREVRRREKTREHAYSRFPLPDAPAVADPGPLEVAAEELLRTVDELLRTRASAVRAAGIPVYLPALTS